MLRRTCQSATSRTSISRDGRRRAIPRARRSRRTSRPRAAALEAALEGLRGEIELPIPTASAVKIGGERAYKLHRQGRRRSRCRSGARRSTRSTSSRIAEGIATLDLRVSSGTYVRSIADALGGHCVSLRRTEVGPFSVEEADAERVLSLDEALGRIGMTVAEAEAERRQKAEPTGGRTRRGRRARRRATAGAHGASRAAADAEPRPQPCGQRRGRRMRIAHAPGQLERQPRAVAIGTFDGVHRGHLSVIQAAVDSGLAPTVITFDPHPRVAFGNEVELITTLERRLELFADAGVESTLVAPFTPELMALEPETFAERYLSAIGATAIAAGPNFRFGAKRRGDRDAARRARVRDPRRRRRSPGCRRRRSAPRCARAMSARRRRCSGGRSSSTASSSPATSAAARSATRRRTSRSSRASPARAYGIYAGSALGHRAAISIGTNPHYGGLERRIEPFLLDFDGDLYGKRLIVEVWERLRDEAVFASEEELDRPDRPRRRGDAGRGCGPSPAA